MAWYRAGTITLTAGSATVVGAGTAWVKYARAGDLLSLPGQALEVKSITSDTQLELAVPYSGAGGAGIGYALMPTQGYVPDALAAMQQILNEFGDIWQAWQAGDLQGRGLVLKGVEDDVADLPMTGNTAGDGYIAAGSKLYVWNGAAWAYAGEMVTTTELLQLRQDARDARSDALSAAALAANKAIEASGSAQVASLAGRVYATPAEGVASVGGVADGQFYNVRSASGAFYMDEYQNVGGVATPTGKSYPSADGLEQSFINVATSIVEMANVVIENNALV